MNSAVIKVKRALAKRKLLTFRQFIKRSETDASVAIPQETKPDDVIDIGRHDSMSATDFIC